MLQQKSLRQFCYLAILLPCLLLSFSCQKDDVYLYDKTGFIPESSKRNYKYPNRGYVYPNSRAYGNPYTVPSQQYYHPYDQDYYYVPPVHYKNVEPLYDSGGIDMKY